VSGEIFFFPFSQFLPVVLLRVLLVLGQEEEQHQGE
jgi:hypothetical protein